MALTFLPSFEMIFGFGTLLFGWDSLDCFLSLITPPNLLGTSIDERETTGFEISGGRDFSFLIMRWLFLVTFSRRLDILCCLLWELCQGGVTRVMMFILYLLLILVSSLANFFPHQQVHPIELVLLSIWVSWALSKVLSWSRGLFPTLLFSDYWGILTSLYDRWGYLLCVVYDI